jgi:hypothetical protein
LSASESKSRPEEETKVEDVRKHILQEMAENEELEQRYLEVAESSAEAARVIGDLHETPNLQNVRQASATLRSVGADMVALEIEYFRKRAFTSKMHAVVVATDQSGLSAEEKSALARLEANIRMIDGQEQKLTTLNSQLRGSWHDLESALTTVYAELREERQTAFQNRMQILGAAITILVALFTIVSTLKTLGLI